MKHIAITLGDPAGIGPEITAKALAKAKFPEGVVPVVYGSERVWALGCKAAGVPDLLARIGPNSSFLISNTAASNPGASHPAVSELADSDPSDPEISASATSGSGRSEPADSDPAFSDPSRSGVSDSVAADPKWTKTALKPQPSESGNRAFLRVCEGVDEILSQSGALELGKVSEGAGLAQLRFLQTAAADLVAGRVQGLVTAPVNKAAIMRTGLDFTGHTEFLQEKFGVPRVVMLMAGPRLKVALATTHLALSQVPQALSVDSLREVLRIAHDSLKKSFGIPKPQLAVLGLNPHAGEDGKFGDEETRIVAPALDLARGEGIAVSGPFAADGYFAHWERQGHDAVVALYHDQGLIPFKMLDGATGVNVTLGLPRPRTSPDHGVAYDIAGKGVADHRSMAAALDLCVQMVLSGE